MTLFYTLGDIEYIPLRNFTILGNAIFLGILFVASYLSEIKSLELFIMQQRAIREATQLKSVLNSIPEAVMIVKDTNLNKPKVEPNMSMVEGNVENKPIPDYRLQFCNKATAQLAGERLDAYTKEVLEKTKLLSKRIFSKYDVPGGGPEKESTATVTPPKGQGSFMFRKQLISLDFILQELLVNKQLSVQ